MIELGIAFGVFWVLVMYLSGIGVPQPNIIYWTLAIYTSVIALIKLPVPEFWLVLSLVLTGIVTFLYW